MAKTQKKTKSPSPAGKVPTKGRASVAPASGSGNAPNINIGLDRKDRAGHRRGA